MFETALLRKHGKGFTSVDAGLIAETLLFYSNVHIVAHFGVLVDLLKTIGGDTLISLLENKLITFTYLRSDYGTVNVTQNGITLSEFITMRLTGTDAGKRKIKTKDSIYLAFERALGKSAKTRRLTARFLNHISIIRDIAVPSQPKGIPGLANANLDDALYVREAVKRSIVEIAPFYTVPKDFRFGVIRSSSGFIIDHNVDMAALNASFKKSFPSSDATLDAPLLIDQLLEARADLQLASNYMAELVTNPMSASIVRLRLTDLMAKRDRNISEIEMFQSTLLNDARALRESINSGEHTFDEFMVVLAKASRFREWLRARNPDANLLSEYYKSAMAETLVSKLPSKIARFVFARGLGTLVEALFPSGLGAATSVGLEAADHFLVDRLLRGWRPTQFVEGPLQKFSA